MKIYKSKLIRGKLADGKGRFCAVGHIMRDLGVPPSHMDGFQSPGHVATAHPEHVPLLLPLIEVVPRTTVEGVRYRTKSDVGCVMAANDCYVRWGRADSKQRTNREQILRAALAKIGHELS